MAHFDVRDAATLCLKSRDESGPTRSSRLVAIRPEDDIAVLVRHTPTGMIKNRGYLVGPLRCVLRQLLQDLGKALGHIQHNVVAAGDLVGAPPLSRALAKPASE